MKTKRFIIFVLSTWFVSAAVASAQQDNLPPRAFQRFGSTKLRHGSRILCLAYSHDGQVLAAGGGNDPVRLWNPKTGELIRDLGEPAALALAFSPSGETLLFGGYQKTVRLWNFRLNKETGRLDGHKAPVKAITVSPDASLIVTGSQDGAIFLWDINTKSKVGDLPAHTEEINALAYVADADGNSFLISGSGDRKIIIWSPDNEQKKLKLQFDAGHAVLALAVSADAKSIYSAGDDHVIRRFDLAGKQTGVFKGHDGPVVSLFLRGDTLISGSADKTIRFWNAKTAEPIRTLPRGAGDCDALAVTKAGDYVATAGLNNVIRIYESGGKEVVLTPPGIPSGLIGMSLSRDNQRLAAVSAEGQIYVWNPQAGKLLKQWDSKQTGDIVLAFAPDSRTLASAASTVCIWNADTGQEIATLPIKVDDPVATLAYSADGKTLAVGMRSGEIELWDLKEKKLVNTLKYVGALHAIAWSPDGKKLAAGGGARLYVFDPNTSAILKTFDFKEGGPTPTFPTIRSLAFGPDSKTLAAGGWDAITRIYNLNAKNPADPREVRLCEGHLSAIESVAFSPDGRTLVTGSFDKTVRLWEAFSGKQIAAFKAHFGEVTGVAFANDGRSVFSAGMDTVAYHWDVPGFNSRKLPDLTMPPQELEDAWTTLLTEETPRGHEVMWKCIASAKQAIPFLTKDKKLYLLDPERVKKLFRDLDSSHFPTRMAAQTELSNYGRWMEGRYDYAIANPPSLEYKRRVEMLKDKVNATNSPSLAQERLRMRRIMLICEQSGSPDALAALKQIAERGPEEDIREEAAASVRRLSKR